MIYLAIIVSKILENMLSTLRLIVVANGKKKLGAILNGVIALIWILVTGIVIIDINKDLLKIIFFCAGSVIGSYLGSVVEERIALGTNTLMCITDTKYEQSIKKCLKDYQINTISEKDSNYSIILILIKRKEIKSISKLLKSIDNSCIIISQKAKNISNLV